MKVTLDNGTLCVEADTLGAELTSVRFQNEEKLWQGEEWRHHAPILFPVCGCCRLTLGGREYPLGKHGFAQEKEFQCKVRRKNAVTFELCSDEETIARFPFEFAFRVRYALNQNQLRIVYEIENPSDETMYFSCGGHESFALSGPLKNFELRFPHSEQFTTLLHDNEGCLTGVTHDLGEGTNFPLPEEFLTNGNTLIFRNLRSRYLWLCERGGKRLAKISFKEFKHLLLWRLDGKNMICIEPWHNLPDGAESIPFPQKEGIVALPPHQSKKFVRTIEYLAE